jgi:hypothetical protein
MVPPGWKVVLPARSAQTALSSLSKRYGSLWLNLHKMYSKRRAVINREYISTYRRVYLYFCYYKRILGTRTELSGKRLRKGGEVWNLKYLGRKS